MQENDYQISSNNIRKYYYSIGSVFSPALKQIVIFNHYGLRHLFGNRNGVRSKKEILHRYNLLKYTEIILSNVKEISGTRKLMGRKSIMEFFSIERYIDDKKVRLIIRRLNKGVLHFYSIMNT
ncbi:MAG: hypothetical protein WCW03_01705 [Candidatus Paceibacterota bacterium]|jgi:hypothetical protein